MLVVGEGVYAMLIEPDGAQLWKSDIGASDLEQAVDTIRSTISIVENGRRLTYPFDAATSYKLYGQLFGPVAARLPAVPHLIFEPDGAMLRLPINLLVTADTGLADYERSEEHTSELQSLMRISYAVFCLKKKKKLHDTHEHTK